MADESSTLSIAKSIGINIISETLFSVMIYGNDRAKNTTIPIGTNTPNNK